MKKVFIHWGPHRAHKAWAESINCEICPFIPRIFFFLRFQSPLIHQFAAALFCFRIPKADIYLIEGMGCIIPAIIRKKKGSKIIMINDDPFFYDYGNLSGLRKKIYDILLSNVDAIVSTSGYMDKQIPKKVKAKRAINPLFADIRKFSTIDADLKQKTLGFIGRLRNKKGIDILLSVFSQVHKKDNSYRLYLVGNIEDKSLRKKLEKLDHKVRDNIHITGFIDNPWHYMEKIGTYVNPARHEPFGINVIEAMCAGIPPIVTSNCGAADIVAKAAPELVVKADRKAIISKINWLNSDLRGKQILGEKCRKEGEKYTIKRSVEAFKKIFNSLGF